MINKDYLQWSVQSIIIIVCITKKTNNKKITLKNIQIIIMTKYLKILKKHGSVK